MNKETLLEIVEKAEMTPLVDQEENPGQQIGWYKTCNEPIPPLDEYVKESENSISNLVRVQRRQIADLYQYVVYCPLKWFA